MAKLKKSKGLNSSSRSLKILSCFCENEFQDNNYGSRKRVCNMTSRDGIYRCTVCGKDVTS
jgi:hypothetical protein